MSKNAHEVTTWSGSQPQLMEMPTNSGKDGWMGLGVAQYAEQPPPKNSSLITVAYDSNKKKNYWKKVNHVQIGSVPISTSETVEACALPMTLAMRSLASLGGAGEG